MRLLPVILAILLVAGFSSAANAATCKQACDRYVTCTTVAFPNASADDKKKAFGGCMATCSKHTPEVLACYNQSQGQCMAYFNCVKENYKK